jgi:hypothetical protein
MPHHACCRSLRHWMMSLPDPGSFLIPQAASSLSSTTSDLASALCLFLHNISSKISFPLWRNAEVFRYVVATFVSVLQDTYPLNAAVTNFIYCFQYGALKRHSITCGRIRLLPNILYHTLTENWWRKWHFTSCGFSYAEESEILALVIVRLSPLGPEATNCPIVPAPDERCWVWSSWWNENWQGKPKYSEKTYSCVTLFTVNPT